MIYNNLEVNLDARKEVTAKNKGVFDSTTHLKLHTRKTGNIHTVVSQKVARNFKLKKGFTSPHRLSNTLETKLMKSEKREEKVKKKHCKRREAEK